MKQKLFGLIASLALLPNAAFAQTAFSENNGYPITWTSEGSPSEQDLATLSKLGHDQTKLEDFLNSHPNSSWAPSMRNALATRYRYSGRNTLALNHWNTAWKQLKDSTNTAARDEANHALAAQVEVLSSLGRIDTLHDLLVAAQSRNISDANDRRRIETASEAYSIMVDHPTLSYRCGSLALANIARVEDQPAASIGALIEEPSTINGISLKRLVQLNRQFGLGLVAVKRTDKSPVPVPSVIHWSQNHYGAVMEYRADINYYRVVDPTFRNDLWISAADLDAEASGYFLVPEKARPANWPLVADKESEKVFGRGYPYNINDALDRGCKINPTTPKAGCMTCSGMPVWWVSEPYINLWFSDEPWSYTTSRGEKMALHLTVKQRDSQGTLYTSIRPGVQHNWYSRIFILGMPTSVPFAQASSNWTATLFLPSGGQVTYTKQNPYDEATKTRLDTTYGTPADGTYYASPSLNGNFNLSGFRVFYPDGSMDRYGLMSSEANNTTAYYQFEALWTSHTDPVGNVTTLGYTTYTNSLFAPGQITYKLTQVTDYDGKTTSFYYYTNNPDVLYQVVSPYNQTTTFGYDASTNLNSIVDAVSMTNLLKWDSQGRVTNLITGYGTTAFNYYTNLIPGEGNIGGHNVVTRAVTVTDANGGTNLYAFRFDCSSFMASQFASTNIPAATPLGTLDAGTNSSSSNYAAVSFRNSFHWDPRQCASLSTLMVSNLSNTDYLKARMQHWLGDSNNVTVLDLLSVEQEPSPDGSASGQLTFYDYAGKTLDYLQGTNSQIAVVSRLQPSGQTEYAWTRYNANGYATNVVSTYTLADGVARTRTNVFVYGTNIESFVLGYSLAAYYPTVTGVGFYVTQGNYPGTSTNDIFVQDTSGDLSGAYLPASSAATSAYTNANILLASTNASGGSIHYGGYSRVTNTTTVGYTLWYYNPGFPGIWSREPYNLTQTITQTYTFPLPTTITNEVTNVASLTYNVGNQLTSFRSPSGLTTTNIYNSSGFLTNSTDIEIGRTNSFSYTNGLVYTRQNELGLVVTNFWDGLQRLTGTTDAAGTTSNVYLWLDVSAVKDKLGHWSYFGYDPLRNLIAVTNQNSEVRLAQYCQCGALEYTRDAISNYTYYYYDLAGRLTNVVFPDGYSVSNAYNSLGQLAIASDTMGRATNAYNLQGLLTGVSDAAGLTLSNGFDIMDRVVTETDDRGVTATRSYDPIGRPLTNMVSGQFTNTFTYTSNGLISAADAFSHLTLYANDPAGRMVTRTNANQETNFFQHNASGEVTNLVDGNGHGTYFSYDQFGRLTNRVANNSASVLQLSYDANGRVVTNWTPAFGAKSYVYDLAGRVRTNLYPSDPPVIFTYDPNGRLTNLVDATGTNTLTYTPTGQLATEGGLWANDTITFTYSNRLRSSLTLQQPGGSPWAQYYINDAAKRLTAINNALGTFSYAYDPTRGPLVTGINLPNAAFVTNQYDSFAQLTNTALVNYWGHPLDGYGYSYNGNSWRTGVSRYLGITTNNVTVGYDNIGQVTSWSAQESGGASRMNEQLGYAYDSADNLYLRTNNALVQTFTVDSLNQLSNIVRNGSFTLSGNLPAPVTGSNLTVNGNAALTNGDFTFASTNITLTNGLNTFTVVASTTNVNGVNATNVLTMNLPSTVTFQSDSNGNLTSDGTRSFVYNAENRLTNVYVTNLWQSQLVYDGLGRRRVEKDFKWQSNAWVETNEIHYVYDGTVPIQERDISNNPQVTYTRGLDLSGLHNGLGGIGGLLARTDTNGPSFYHGDGAGNVTALIDANQNIVARYEYDAFGKQLGQWGPLASANRYRFSSKEIHALSGIYDFGVRYYEPNFQRWLNRDPVQEWGGINLYGFVGNSAVNNLDPLGNTWYKPWTWGDDIVSPLSDLMTGGAEAQGVFSMNNQLAANGFVNMQDFLLSRKHFCGVVTAGNMGAVNAVRHIATGATMLYLSTAQMIATGGIASPGGALIDDGIVTAVEVAEDTADVAEEGNFVYRGLAEGENISAGLTARAPGAGNSPISHVAGQRASEWISTTKSEAIATQKYGQNGVVRIDLNKVPNPVVDASGGFPGKPGMISNWAIKDQEVLIQNSVPAGAITRIR